MMVAAEEFFNHVEDFIDYRRIIYDASEQTIDSNRKDLKLFKEFIEREDHTTISGAAAIGFQYHLKNQRNNSAGSINRKIFTLRSYSHHLKTEDVPGAENLPFNDILKIRQGYGNRPQALSLGLIKKLFKAIDRGSCLGIRDYAVYSLMYETGLRVGEVHGLDLASIDMENKKLTVMGKGKKVRVLHMNEELLQVLTEYLALRECFYRHDETEALFVSKKGNRLAIRTMEDNIKKIIAKADLNVAFNVTCHTLRHSFASHLNDEDVDILVIQSLMGHSTTKSTEPYIHPSFQKQRAAIEKLPAVAFMHELIKKGVLDITFQKSRPNRE